MIIIAGTGSPKSEKYITKNVMHCSHCNNDAYWILEKIKYHITLFFLPVVPYKTDYMYYCSICGNMQKLEKVDFENRIGTYARPYKQL